MVLVASNVKPPTIEKFTHLTNRDSDYCPIFDDEILEQEETPLQVWDIVRKKYGNDTREGRIIRIVNDINAVIVWSNHLKPLGDIWDKPVQKWYDEKSIFPDCFPLDYLVLVYRPKRSIPIPKLEREKPEISEQLSLF